MSKLCSIIFSLLLSSSFASADATIEQRLAELESKVAAMQTAITEKLKGCEMTYQFHAYRLNQCDKGAFARSVNVLPGSGSVQLECGYYQLKCEK